MSKKSNHEKRSTCICEIQEELLKSFRQRIKKINSGSVGQSDLDNALMIDRGAALILKTVQVDMNSQILELKTNGMQKTIE